VSLGDAECVPQSLVDNEIACKPPWCKPTKYNNDSCPADALTIRASVYLFASFHLFIIIECYTVQDRLTPNMKMIKSQAEKQMCKN